MVIAELSRIQHFGRQSETNHHENIVFRIWSIEKTATIGGIELALEPRFFGKFIATLGGSFGLTSKWNFWTENQYRAGRSCANACVSVYSVYRG
jgi:hypothetical protein